MNKKLTKGLYVGGVATVVAGASLSVILPVVLTSSVEETKWTLSDTSGDFITGGLDPVAADDLIDEVESGIYEEDRAFTRFDQQFQLYLYEETQVDSIEEQSMLFEWEILDKVKTLKEIVSRGEDTEDAKDQIEDVLEEITEIEEKIDVLSNHYDEGTGKWNSEASGGLDYSSTSLSYDYPNVKLTKAEIESQQKSKFNDEKNNFIKGYPTESEGLNAWPAQRTNSYGGAINDSEALDYLVNRNISITMSSLFSFSIDGSYTVEQKFASKVDIDKLKDAVELTDDELVLSKLEAFLADTITIGTVPTDSLFPFLHSAFTKTEDSDYKLSENVTDSVYYLSSGASNINERSLDVNSLDTNEYAKYLVENTELMSVSHALINAKPNVEGNHLPWIIDKEAVKKLYGLLGGAIGGTASRPYEMMPEVFADGKKDSMHSLTDVFIRNATGNSEGTITKEGNLGTQSADGFVSSMVEGFGLGMIPTYLELTNPGTFTFDDYSSSGLTDIAGQPYNTTNILDVLSDQLAQAEQSFFGGTLTSNKQLDQILSTKTDEDVQNVFGDLFRKVFDPEVDGVNLLYKGSDVAGDNFVGVVVSDEHGVHIVDTSIVDSQADLKDLIIEDLQAIADEQDTSEATVDLNQLFTSFYTSDRQYQFVYENKLGIEGGGEFLDFYFEHANEGDKVASQNDLDNIRSTITNNINSESFTKASAASSSKSEWYLSAIIDDLRNADQLHPEDLYVNAYKMAGGK